MGLWIVIAVILLITVGVIALPLLRRKNSASGDHNAIVYQDQLREIDSDVERGLLSAGEAEALKLEINRRLEKSENEVAEETQSNAFPLTAVITVIVVIPLATLGLYNYLGSPQKPDLPFASRSFAPPPTAANEEMTRLVDTLQKRMEQSPDKIDGWLLLGRSLMTLERFQDATKAYKRALKIEPNRADIAANLAESAFVGAGGKFNQDAREYFALARKINPQEPKALYYLGLDQAVQNNHAEAIQIWVDLMAISPAGAPWLDTVRRRLTAAAQAGNLKVADFSPRLKAAPRASEETAPGPTQEDVKAAQEMSDEDRQAFIRSMVDRLAERLKDTPNDIDGWRRLARAYQVLGETQKAAEVNARIKTLTEKLGN